MTDTLRVSLALCVGYVTACMCTTADDAPTPPTGSTADRHGFIAELTPLIGEYGGIRAIAPDAHALAGSIRVAMKGDRFSPFVWNRENGLTMLATAGSDSWGTAIFTSDDGNVVTGVIHNEFVTSVGFIWRLGAPTIVTNNAFSVIQVDWPGLTAKRVGV